ncbi:MAG: RNA polymerase sigma factor [Rhodobacteraceae bacterium]|nr:RNA polymerase sigma factor [Paracoccaceae bacterium]
MATVLDDTTAAEDAELLARYARGDSGAARLLTARCAPLAYRVAVRMLGDRTEAEDVTQEAMLRLFRAAPGWRAGEAKVTTWLYRVTANLCTDRLRRRPAVALDAIEEPPSAAPSAAAGMIRAARERALQAALARLPERQREAVVLRHLEGLANPEIAEVMGIGVEAVESLTARGKRALAAELAGQREALGFDDDAA